MPLAFGEASASHQQQREGAGHRGSAPPPVGRLPHKSFVNRERELTATGASDAIVCLSTTQAALKALPFHVTLADKPGLP